MAIKFKGVDFIEFDTLLSDVERLVRDNTRKFIELNNTGGLRWTRHETILIFAPSQVSAENQGTNLGTRHYNNPVSAVEE